MNYQKAVDFETYYFVELMHRVKTQGEAALPEEKNQQLCRFADRMVARENPLDSVEQLARRQLTSDMSIFFSDLLERIHQFPPEEAIQKIGEYAKDFLNIFDELSNEKDWQQQILSDIGTDMETETGKETEAHPCGISEFVFRELFFRLGEFFRQKMPAEVTQVEMLLERVWESSDPAAELNPYRQAEELEESVNLLLQLVLLPGAGKAMENYLQGFYSSAGELANELWQLADHQPAQFRALCRGTELPEFTETAPPAPDDLDETVSRLEQRESRKTAEKEEDHHLRKLLRDYLIHEIQELNGEMMRRLHQLHHNPADRESAGQVLDSLKILKDLGQIHKYPAMEKFAGHLQLALENYFQEGRRIGKSVPKQLAPVGKSFENYVDAVLQNREAEGRRQLEENVEAFLSSLMQEESAPETFGWQESLQPVFAEVNRRYIDELSRKIEEIYSEHPAPQLEQEIDELLQHLKYWYEMWQFEGPVLLLNALQALPQKSSAALPEKPVALAALTLLKDELFSTSGQRWQEVAENLQIAAEKRVNIGGALDAFKTVNIRRMHLLQSQLKNTDQSFQTVLRNKFIPAFQQLGENSSLLKNEDLQLLCNYFLTKNILLQNLPEELLDESRRELSAQIDRIIEVIEALPQSLQINKIVQNFDDLFDQLLDKAEASEEMDGETEGLSTESEAVEEEPEIEEEPADHDELEHVFLKEAESYVESLRRGIEELQEKPHNREALKNLGNTAHTLKGSSQMLAHEPVALVAREMESAADKLTEKDIDPDRDLISVFNEGLNHIEKYLQGEPHQLEDKAEEIRRQLQQLTTRAEPDELPRKISESSEAPGLLEEISPENGTKPLDEETTHADTADIISLNEPDPELRRLLMSEAGAALSQARSAAARLQPEKPDFTAAAQLQEALQKIDSAARMLNLEVLINLLEPGEYISGYLAEAGALEDKSLLEPLQNALRVVRELMEGQSVSRARYDEVLADLIHVEDQLPAVQPSRKKEVLEPSRQVLEAFIQEAREFLEDINFLLMKMEKHPQDDSLSYQLMRNLHTLKGSAAMVYQDTIEKLTHRSEDVVELLREKKQQFPAELYDLLFQVVDEVEFIIDSLAGDLKGNTRNFEEIMQRLTEFYDKESDAEIAPPAESTEEAESPAEPAAIPLPPEKEEDYLSITHETESSKKSGRDAYVRLHVNQMDDLLNQTAELVINHTQFKTQLDRYKNSLPRIDSESKNLQNILWYLDSIIGEEQRIGEMIQPYIRNMPAAEDLQKNQIDNIKRVQHNLQIFYNQFLQTMQFMKESSKLYDEQIHKITRLSSQIHDEIMQARLVPIAILFQRFHRPLRDFARKHNKKIKLFVEGESTEMDRLLIEELYEPVLHILRNALDHGIESPEQRRKAGKPEEGSIKISAIHDRNYVTVEVQDDGRGIDPENIRRKALEKELLNKEQADSLSDKELYEFLMYPGFSTAAVTSEVSGRGVGLDVVRHQIQKIKGNLWIDSEPGKGTRFQIRVPISLTVTQAMLVEIAGQSYAMPLMQVEETSKITIRDLDLRDGVYYMRHRAGFIPVLYMNVLLQVRGSRKRPVSVVGEYPVIIVQDQGAKVALLVDNIIHREEVLVKSLGPGLQRVRFITGGSVLADGKVVLVLDIPQIVRESGRIKDSGAALNPNNIGKKEAPAEEGTLVEKRTVSISGRQARLLVVDDSLSIRKFLSGFLSQNGYSVEIAKNGYEALEKMNQQSFDMVITDLEMPQMSGYELIEQIRGEERWNRLPIIVLTGRASRHIQQLTSNLGADEYLVKPFKEQNLLEIIQAFVITDREDS
ncbi:MAG: response regulator [Calditrichia bacterium]